MTSITHIPVPKSGKISELLHISDVHIRNGDEIVARYDEYNTVFHNLFEVIKTRPSIHKNEVAIVITGDTFHHKSKVETPGIKLFTMLMRNLGTLAPVYIILGNHDFKQDQMDNTIDFLDAFDVHQHQNVCFLENTGLYQAGNVGFGLVSIKDTLRFGSGSGITETLPSFPSPLFFPETVKTTVALFHGSMVHSKYSEKKKTDEGYPWEWLDVGYNPRTSWRHS